MQNAAVAWDRAAAGWDGNAALIRAWLTEANAAMLDAARIGPGMRVLDVAAGAGDQSIDIALRVGPAGAVLATDVSAAMVALADANLRRAGLHWAEARIADAEALQLDGAGFDAAICRLGLMFCQRPLVALRGILRALAPGGALCRACVLPCRGQPLHRHHHPDRAPARGPAGGPARTVGLAAEPRQAGADG